MEMTLLHVHGESIGYGRLGVKLAAELEAKGIDIYDHLEPPPEMARLSGADRAVHRGRRHKRTNVVGWVSVPTHARGWYRDQFTWIFTMWESTELPEAFRETLHNFDLVVVPSMHNVELFSRWHPNVAYAPLGVDPAEWHYTPRQEPGLYFDVLIGGSGGRKGLDIALRAFAAAFPEGSWGDGPIPRLVMKSPKHNFGLETPEKQALPWPSSDRLLAVHGRLSAEEERALYASAHCYIQPSRGEGFGLQPLQAMAQGIPTVLTDAHGHEAFAKLGWPVSATLEEAGYFIFGGSELGMKWWLPSLDECVDHLRDIYANYEASCQRAAASAAEVTARFTWGRCADDVVGAIGMDRLCTPHTLAKPNPVIARLPKIGARHVLHRQWVAPEQKLYKVVVSEDWKADIGGMRRFYEKGQVYWETADVKRILFEAGRLDPCCYGGAGVDQQGEDGGLLESQVKRINQAHNAYCPTCKQRLNSKPALEDDLMRLVDRGPLRLLQGGQEDAA